MGRGFKVGGGYLEKDDIHIWSCFSENLMTVSLFTKTVRPLSVKSDPSSQEMNRMKCLIIVNSIFFPRFYFSLAVTHSFTQAKLYVEFEYMHNLQKNK